jgi:hypothetical protein
MVDVSQPGAPSSENAGMSSVMVVRINHAVNPRFSRRHCLVGSESAPKARPQKA